jgi:hypothetical protein
MEVPIMFITYSTRSNDGQTSDHFDIESALEYFISDSGYRLDFHFEDGRVLYIHRAEYGDEIPEEKINHPAFKNYSQALAKVLLYAPNSTQANNVVHVNFGLD